LVSNELKAHFNNSTIIGKARKSRDKWGRSAGKARKKNTKPVVSREEGISQKFKF
jgi:hypothetical protein